MMMSKDPTVSRIRCRPFRCRLTTCASAARALRRSRKISALVSCMSSSPLRQGYLQTRTARINAVRGHLREFGASSRWVPTMCGRGCTQPWRPTPFPHCSDPRSRSCWKKSRARGEGRGRPHRAHPLGRADARRPTPAHRARRGVLTATALVAFVGDIHRFRSGRDFAAYLGLTPRSTPRCRAAAGAITKQGNTYVRMLLVHGPLLRWLGATGGQHKAGALGAHRVSKLKGNLKQLLTGIPA